MATKTTTSDSPTPELPEATHRDSISISPVYHVGDLGGERETPYTSYEGRGVSISIHPTAWEEIIRSDGTSTHERLKTYKITNPDAEFYYIDPEAPLDVERQWCVENEYVEPARGHKVTYENGTGETAYMEFLSEETAQMEAEARHGEIAETEILTLGPSGVEYWLDAFRQAPEGADPILIAALTPVWYAQENGYDGVWWDEKYDPANYSAPRGVIFQPKLDSWERAIEKTTSPNH